MAGGTFYVAIHHYNIYTVGYSIVCVGISWVNMDQHHIGADGYDCE